jgi:hypothetical protein
MPLSTIASIYLPYVLSEIKLIVFISAFIDADLYTQLTA